MSLIYDNYGCYWVWVSDKDQNEELSPQFDDEQDALQWQKTLKKIFTGK